MRGRKPIPGAIKLAMGNPGKRKLQDEITPGGLPSCPRHLDLEARREWRRVLRLLGPLKFLSAGDRAILAIYCAAWSRWKKAEERMQASPEVIATKSGNAILNPWRSVANRAEETMLKAASEIGLTPSSRARLGAAAPTRQPSLAELLLSEPNECSPNAKPN